MLTLFYSKRELIHLVCYTCSTSRHLHSATIRDYFLELRTVDTHNDIDVLCATLTV